MISILSYSDKGAALGVHLKEQFEADTVGLYRSFQGSIKEYFAEIWEVSDLIIFISACGIAVRTIAPYLQSKDVDPAIIVIDDTGRNVISLLSGHLGGANAWAYRIAELIGAHPVITTATDMRGLEGLDLYARRMNFAIEKLSSLTALTAAMVNGQPLCAYNPHGYELVNYGVLDEIRTEEELRNLGYLSLLSDCEISESYVQAAALVEDNALCAGKDRKAPLLLISEKEFSLAKGFSFAYLRPPVFVVGMGAKRGVSFEDVEELFLRSLKQLKCSPLSVATLATIDLKAQEPAFLSLAEKYKLQVKLYSSAELKPYEKSCQGSSFVEEITGVASVSATAALASSDMLLLEKIKGRGCTLSVGYKSP